MAQHPLNIKYLATLRILNMALIAALVIAAGTIAGVVLPLNDKLTLPLEKEQDLVLMIAAGAMLLSGASAWALYRKGVTKVRNLTGPVNNKLSEYRSTFIQYLAVAEMGGMGSVLCIFLTGDLRLLMVTAVSLLLLIRVYPVKRKLVVELNLDWNEEKEL